MEIKRCALCGYELYPLDEACPQCGTKVKKRNIVEKQKQDVKPKKPKTKHLVLDKPIFFAVFYLVSYLIISNLYDFIISFFVKVRPDFLLNNVFSFAISVLLTVFLALIVKLRLGEDFTLGFTWLNIRRTIILALPFLIPDLLKSILALADEGRVSPLVLIMALIAGLQPGITEEIIFRSLFLGNMMRCWNRGISNIYKSNAIAATIFGLSHLSNLMIILYVNHEVMQNILFNVICQVFYAASLGFMFGAIYLRTRNICGPIILHTLMDAGSFAMSFAMVLDMSGAEGLAYGLMQEFDRYNVLFTAIVVAYSLGIGLFLIRPSKQWEIMYLWLDKGDEGEG